MKLADRRERTLILLSRQRQSTTLFQRTRLSFLVACRARQCSVGLLIVRGATHNAYGVHRETDLHSFALERGPSLKPGNANHRLEVQAFLILERVTGSKEFLVSVLLQADGQFIGKSSLGTAAEGQEILLSLRWDKPKQRFVASSQAVGSAPVLSFIPFSSPGACRLPFSPDSRWRRASC